MKLGFRATLEPTEVISYLMAFWKLWIQSATAVRNLNMRKLNVQEQMGLIATADAELVAAWSTGTQRI